MKLLIIIIAATIVDILCFEKVLVPAVYKEWYTAPPAWFKEGIIQKKYGFSTFLYQKLNKNKKNYIETNRGAEGGVFLKYIIDHYDRFPDIAIFVHSYPQQHQKDWIEMMNCIHPKATYMNINFQNMCGSTSEWY